MLPPVTKESLKAGLTELGVRPDMALEVHCSLGHFGSVDGGATTVIEALKELVGPGGAIVMPSFRYSPPHPLTEWDRRMGITSKSRYLTHDAERSGMGVVSDTFRHMPDVRSGPGLFRVSAWGKDVDKHVQGFQHLIETNGWALLLGVDIYRLSAMHYVEDVVPREVAAMFKPSEAIRKQYPEDEWMIEAGQTPVKAWYTIQERGYRNGYIMDTMIGPAKCMLLEVKPVLRLYRQALLRDPFGLYGLKKPG